MCKITPPSFVHEENAVDLRYALTKKGEIRVDYDSTGFASDCQAKNVENARIPSYYVNCTTIKTEGRGKSDIRVNMNLWLFFLGCSLCLTQRNRLNENKLSYVYICPRSRFVRPVGL